MGTKRRALKKHSFCRWMKKTELTDQALLDAIEEMAHGLIDANLGGNVYKKRIALPGQGKSGGARTIIATNLGDRWIFLHGFEKNERENIEDAELSALKKYSKDILARSDIDLDRLVSIGEMEEL